AKFCPTFGVHFNHRGPARHAVLGRMRIPPARLLDQEAGTPSLSFTAPNVTSACWYPGGSAMRTGLLLPVLLVALGFSANGQPPAIDQEGVRNAASRIPPSLPGGELAPGA